MGATIGISYFIYLVNTPLAEVSGIALLFIQQCIIVASLQKIFQLSKKKDTNWLVVYRHKYKYMLTVTKCVYLQVILWLTTFNTFIGLLIQ